MPLAIVAVPIGNPDDITLRAIKTLQETAIVIGEEAKPTRQLLKALGIPVQEKSIHLYKEHSQLADIAQLVELCRNQLVALITDAGTPGFAEPGPALVQACRQSNVPVYPVPGVSSLATLISVGGIKLDSFMYAGFPPRDSANRAQAMRSITRMTIPVVLMDTPYRLTQTLAELAALAPQRRCTLGVDLTAPTEDIFEGRMSDALTRFRDQKRKFILLLYPAHLTVR